MIDLKRIEEMLEAGYENSTQGMRHAGAYGRALVYLKLMLETMPEDKRDYWLDRMQATAEKRREEVLDSQRVTQ